jgi:hypothetical protein
MAQRRVTGACDGFKRRYCYNRKNRNKPVPCGSRGASHHKRGVVRCRGRKGTFVKMSRCGRARCGYSKA